MYKYSSIIFFFTWSFIVHAALDQDVQNSLFKPLPPVVNAATKTGMSMGAQIGSTLSSVSYFRTQDAPFHPASSQLFPQANDLAQKLSAFLTSIDSEHYFLVFFSQIHLLILHEIYVYLTKIYTVFNMSHIDTVSQYVTKEQTEALNKKTLIINYLMDIIEAQSNGAILARFPTLPKNIATYAGNALMQNDYGADLNLLLDESEVALFAQPEAQQMIFDMRSNYLKILGEYLVFFQAYTSTLHQKQTINGLPSHAFIQHATHIQKIIDAASPRINQSTSVDQTIATLKNIKKINPPLFFYNTVTMRALQVIPTLAQSLPSTLSSIPWPATIVKAAQTNAPIKNKFGNLTSTEPLAYFLDAQGNTTNSFSQAKKLFINIPSTSSITGSYVYKQELLPQPMWLNSSDGVMRMLQVCLGDFSGLLEESLTQEDILDPCLRCIITNASVQGGLRSSQDSLSCNNCESFISTVTEAIQKTKGIVVPEDDTDIIIGP